MRIQLKQLLSLAFEHSSDLGNTLYRKHTPGKVTLMSSFQVIDTCTLAQWLLILLLGVMIRVYISRETHRAKWELYAVPLDVGKVRPQ